MPKHIFHELCLLWQLAVGECNGVNILVSEQTIIEILRKMELLLLLFKCSELYIGR